MYIWAHRIRAIHRGGHEQQLLAVAAGQVAPDSTDAYPNAPQRTPTPPERHETVQDMFITPLYRQHASHTLASRAYGPQPHMRS